MSGLPFAVGESPLRAVCIFDNYWGTTLAFAAALGARGVPLHVYGAGAVRWSRYTHRRASCPPVEDVGRFLPWLSQRVRNGEIERVAPTTDLMAWYLAELRDDFSPEVRRTITPMAQIECALIKPQFNARCMALGQPVPLTLVPEHVEDAVLAARTLGYPLVLKPKSHLVVGSAQRGGLINDEAELRKRFAQFPVARGHEPLADRYPELRWPLLQRYLPAALRRVYSVSGYKDPESGVVAAAVSCKRHQWPAIVGTSIVQRTVDDARILRAGLRTIDALLDSGIFEIELVDDDHGLAAIDLNPRAFGFMNLDIARGNDLPWLWFCSTHATLTRPEVASKTENLPNEARLLVPYLIGRLLRLWNDQQTHAAARPLDAGSTAPEPAMETEAPRTKSSRRTDAWVSMLGRLHDPLPMLLANVQQLRHPRSLIRNLSAIASIEAKAHGAPTQAMAAQPTAEAGLAKRRTSSP